jgi:hypothetical protein
MAFSLRNESNRPASSWTATAASRSGPPPNSEWESAYAIAPKTLILVNKSAMSDG